MMFRLMLIALVLAVGARAQESGEKWKPLYERGVAQLEKWNFVEARKTLSRAIERARAFEAPDKRLAMSLEKMSAANEMARQYEPARKCAAEAVEVLEALHGDKSELLRPALETLARLHRVKNDFQGAATVMQRVLAIADASLEEGDAEPLEVIVPLAKDLRAGGKIAEAVPFFERGLKIMEKRYGDPLHLNMNNPVSDLAAAYGAVGRYAEAAALHRRWIAIIEKAKGKDHPNVGAGLEKLAAAQLKDGRPADAEASYRRWLKIIVSISSADNPNVAALRGRIARAMAAQEKHAEAVAEFDAAVAMFEKYVSKTTPILAKLLLERSAIQTTLGRHDDAVAGARRALEILRDPKRARVHETEKGMLALARALAGAKSWRECNGLARAVLAAREKRGGTTHPSLIEPLRLMARALSALGNEEAGDAAEERAAALEKAAKGS